MDAKRLFAATIVCLISPLMQTADGSQWTLATADTAIMIALGDRDKPVILELKNPGQQFNWIQRQNDVPLLNQVVVNGQTVTPQWQYQGATLETTEGTKLTLTYADASTGLSTAVEWWARPGAGPIRAASVVTNRGGNAVTIPYCPTLAFQLTTPSTTPLEAWHFSADGMIPDPVGVYHESVTPTYQRRLRTEPMGASIPLAILGSGTEHGLYVGTEWSFGDIQIGGTPSNARAVGISSGNVIDFQKTLPAGGVFEAPPSFVGTYQGNVDDAGNSLRKYLYNYNVPEVLRNDSTYPKVQWNACVATGKTPGSWDSVESKYYPLVDDIASLGFEEVMLDVGWWAGAEPNADPQDWPSGMKAAADYAHEKGLRFGLYWSDGLDMALPEHQQIRGDRIKRLFEEYDADMWRSDGTSGVPLGSSYDAVEGFYKMLDRLQQEVPGFEWENCNGGGRIKDYGAMKRAVKIFNSDTYKAIDVRQAFYDSSFALLPMQLEGHLVTIHTNSTDGSNRPTGAREMKFAFRSTSMGAPEWIIDAPNGANSTPWSDEEKAAVASCVETYKSKLRPLIRTADLYHIFPRPDDHVWDGLEYYDPKTHNGAVYIFKPDSDEDTHRILLRGLDADLMYHLTFEDGSNPAVSMLGADLMNNGIPVTLHGQYVSEIMFFEAPEPSSVSMATVAAILLCGMLRHRLF